MRIAGSSCSQVYWSYWSYWSYWTYTLIMFIRIIAATCFLILPSAVAQTISSPDKATPAQLQSIRTYIKKSWATLMRSNAKLAEAAVDPKFRSTSGRWPVYLSQKEDLKQVEQKLMGQMPQGSFDKIELRKLPDNSTEIREQGLLYLPYPY